MPTLAQRVFKLIVLHNKLCDESTLNSLFQDDPEPVKALERLVLDGQVRPTVGDKIVQIYRKQLPKAVRQKGDDGSVTPSMRLAEAWSQDADAGVEMVEEVAQTSRAGSSQSLHEPPTLASTTGEHAVSERSFELAHDDSVDHIFGGPESDTGGTEMSLAERLEHSGPFKASPEGIKLIHRYLKAARKFDASDVHIKSGSMPVLRVAGHLRPLEGDSVPPEKIQEGLLSLLNDEQREQFLADSDLDFCYDAGELGRFRCNFMMQHRGMDGIFRLIPSKIRSFEALGLPPVVERFTQYKTGLVLVTGPKGCGKTTTLAALIDLINRTRPEHIITIEDPIEFVHPCKKGHVNQREVGPHTESFSAALRSALREAPDVIVVGEMRDLETIELAITASETGHLVFGTLHTPDAVRTIGRILDVFPPKQQSQIRAMVSESLRGVVSQLLVPTPDGKSMVLAVEVLVNTPAIGNLIRENRTFQLPSMMQTGRKLGMQTMDDSLLTLAQASEITREEAISLAWNPGPMKARLAQVVVE